jgi:tetratricopeptide (TPR) repeat protein
MTNGSINIDDIKGKVSGIIHGSTGSLSADVIRIEGNLTININNPTKEIIAELKQIQQAPLEASEIKNQVTTHDVKETKRSINFFKNLLSEADSKVGAPTQAIRAGNLQISRNELLLKTASTMANEYLLRGEYHNALDWYNKAIHINPNDAIMWLNKGVVLNKLNRYNEAIQCFDKAIEINPNYTKPWYNKSASLNKLNRYNEAIQCIDRAIQMDPNYALAWNNKGATLNNLNRYNEAIQCYERAIQIDPNDANPWNNKGNALSKLGRYEEAITSYDKAIEIKPELADFWNNKCYVLHNKLGRSDEAKRCFNRARQLGYVK